MRPAGDISKALLQAVEKLATPERGPTLQEVAHAACVGVDKARQMLQVMKFRGHVSIPRTRRVPGRNRPVAEYQLPMPQQPAANDGPTLAAVMQAWG